MGCWSISCCCNIKFHSTNTNAILLPPPSPSRFSISFSHPLLSAHNHNHNGIRISLRSPTKLRAKFEKFEAQPSQDPQPSSSSLETITTEDTSVKNSNDEGDRCCHFYDFDLSSVYTTN